LELKRRSDETLALDRASDTVADSRPHARQPKGLVDSVGAGYDCSSVVASVCRGEGGTGSGPDPGAAWAEALERFSAMSVPERAAEVLKMEAPAIAESWEKACFKHGADMKRRLGEVNARLERVEAAVREEVMS
jgi:hypothetical protein